jgi:flagellar biosynthetic protein FliR
MPANLTLSAGTLFSFLLVLARVSGALAFVPLPGLSAVAGPAKVAFAIGFTLALSAQWPIVQAQSLTVSTLAAWAAAEAAIGIAIGVSVTIVLEAFTLSAQVLGLQAGYAFAQTIDPNTQADSGILLVLAQLLGGMFFFAMGLDRQILRLFALSLAKIPAGTWVLGRGSAESLIHLASSLFSVGIRLALPVVALLVMVDVALALMGRLNSQLQLLSLAFPAKMLLALLVLSWIAALFPRILGQLAGHCWSGAIRTLGI